MTQAQVGPGQGYYYYREGAQIGGGRGGMKPLAQNGTVIISQDGTLTLLGSKGDLIDQAPIAQVSWKKMPMTAGQTIFLTLDQKRYSVSIGSLASDIASGNVKAALFTSDRKRVSKSKHATGELIEAIEAFPGRPL